MDITDVLANMGGLQAMARDLGISEQTAAAGAEQLMPALLGGLKRQARSQPTAASGLEGFGAILEQLGGSGLLENVLGAQPTEVARGNDVLSQIFGSRDVSRTVAEDAASRSGIDPALLRKMLPILAMLVTGYMARQRNAGDAPAPGAMGSSSGGLGSLLGGVASMLDLNGDGNPLDDILRMANRGR